MEKFPKKLTVYGTGQGCSFLAVLKLPLKAYRLNISHDVKLFKERNAYQLLDHVWEKLDELPRTEDVEYRRVPERLRKFIEKSLYYDVGV